MKMPTHKVFYIADNESDQGLQAWVSALSQVGVNLLSEWGRGNHLLIDLRDFFKERLPLTLLLELNYTDRDFRSLYYRHYSKVYRDIDRNSIRFHVFKGIVKSEDLLPPSKNIDRQYYEGYFCLSMLDRPLLGRTVLRFNPENTRNFICKTEFESNIFGSTIKVEGFPFIWQDLEVIRCAHASIWMVHRYFSTRYSYHRDMLPHEILWGDTPKERLVPSKGLLVEEVGTILSRIGHHPEVINKDYEPEEFFCQLHSYVESRIPIIACSDELRHAVVALGRTAPKWKEIVPRKFKKDYENFDEISYWDSSDFCESIIVNDDNYFPYRIWKRDKESSTNNPEERSVAHIEYIIVPLYEKIYLSARLAKVYGLTALSHPEFGIFSSARNPLGKTLSTFIKPNESLILRTTLTSNRTYLRHIKKTTPDNSFAQYLRTFNFPKFIWIVEVSTSDYFFKNIEVKYSNGESTGLKIAEIVLDATAGNVTDFDNAWFYIRYPGIFIINPKFIGAGFPDRLLIPVESESFPELLLVNSE